jgi:hypothetical protein
LKIQPLVPEKPFVGSIPNRPILAAVEKTLSICHLLKGTRALQYITKRQYFPKNGRYLVCNSHPEGPRSESWHRSKKQTPKLDTCNAICKNRSYINGVCHYHVSYYLSLFTTLDWSKLIKVLMSAQFYKYRLAVFSDFLCTST